MSAPEDFPTDSVSARGSAVDAFIFCARNHGVNLTRAQIIHENNLKDCDLSVPELVACANKMGFRSKLVRLNISNLNSLNRALPAIIVLKNGYCMVLKGVEGAPEGHRFVLQDPLSADDVKLTVDEVRLEGIWSGDVILVKRKYAIGEEEQPFSLGLISALIFRERRVVRDLAVSALMISLFALAPVFFFRLLADKVIYYKAQDTFYVLCIALGLIVVFEAVFSYLRRYLLLHLTTRIDIKLADYMFEKVLRLPIDFFERTQVGKIASDMNEMWRIRNFLTGQMFGTILDSMTLLIFLPVMFFFSPLLTIIVLLVCAMIVGWIVLMLPGVRKRNGAVVRAEAARAALMYQTLAGIRTIKSLALEPRQRNLWDWHVTNVARLKMELGTFGNMLQTVVQPLERFMVSGVYAIGVYLVLTSDDTVSLGALFAFLMLTQRVAAPLMQMAQLINQYDEARGAVGTVGSLVNQPAEEGQLGQGVQSPLVGHVVFSNVRFSYVGSKSPALDGVSFEVLPGTTLGIVGRSGSGKTTVTRLLQRLHSSYDGLIKVDGVDVREYELSHMRRSLGVVLQDNFLFSGTIRENITAAKSDASFDEVVRAARMAGAEEFIERLPRGYETFIFEGSSNLSGGQRQRLAIARALIVNPRILILDEATSALDPESEAIVNTNIDRIAAGRTVIVVSHRLSSLVKSDAILVLERGGVHDIGRHEELLERSEIYSELWYQQNAHTSANAGTSLTNLKGPIRAA